VDSHGQFQTSTIKMKLITQIMKMEAVVLYVDYIEVHIWELKLKI